MRSTDVDTASRLQDPAREAVAPHLDDVVWPHGEEQLVKRRVVRLSFPRTTHLDVGRLLATFISPATVSPVPRTEGAIVTERWVSVDDVAAHLGVAKDSVNRWIDSKSLPAHKIGKLWKFRLTEVDG